MVDGFFVPGIGPETVKDLVTTYKSSTSNQNNTRHQFMNDHEEIKNGNTIHPIFVKTKKSNISFREKKHSKDTSKYLA